ncbi:hypothetical protein BDA99DRAFT_559603 [Phascolomyces articulosus]|uniref:Uncharacterized protein n=1 Tax=Phascolomyces articulosus TaxID=60185 RepID=A0AAD5K167_9FUNG|nr:hypothetical protein BDA99DRAFT_559603 [Phascolomyces articulosus]
MLCLAKPNAKDCDGRKLLGKRYSFDQNNNRKSVHSSIRTATTTTTKQPSSMYHRNNNDKNLTNTTSTPIISINPSSPITIHPTTIPSKSNGIKPSASYSMPIHSQRPLSFPPPGLDDEERIKLMRDIMQAKEELLRFRNEMDGLAQQIDGMEIDLKDSKDRVCTYTDKLVEIEDDLTSTQEVNVDLQVLLENAVKTQKESDGKTTHMIRNMHSNLANIVYENSQLQERLASLALHQEKYHGNVVDVGERMREYAHMLEQAQGTIQFLQAPRHSSSSRPMIKTKEEIMNALSIRDGLSSRRASDVSSMYLTEDEEVLNIASRKQSETTGVLFSSSISPDSAVASISSSSTTTRAGSISPDIAELYRHRIIRKRPSLPSGMSPLFSSGASIPPTPPTTHVHRTTIKKQPQPQPVTASLPIPPPPHPKQPTSSASSAGIALALDEPNLGGLHGPSNSPQQGLRLLLRNQGGHGLGLSSIADSK